MVNYKISLLCVRCGNWKKLLKRVSMTKKIKKYLYINFLNILGMPAMEPILFKNEAGGNK